MSKSQELIAKQHPVSAGDILGMVAGLAAAAIHIYETEPNGKLSQLFAIEGIWKDPVTAMQRTKALGLLHKTVRTNASMCR
ncbi:hypothetical protein [Eikenella sp. Marseille-P7795]|uniref:hypothetical protein n=1 Tax=Eikenella sp. Marseille-P7795 TaxID=2866577 RepID=UPI001CE476D0|nr:hypothetical protein [Eikenella sp. Marseille-P7795]